MTAAPAHSLQNGKTIIQSYNEEKTPLQDIPEDTIVPRKVRHTLEITVKDRLSYLRMRMLEGLRREEHSQVFFPGRR